MNRMHVAIIFLLFLSPAFFAQEKDARALVDQVVAAIGGRDAFYAAKDVSYTYIYHRVGPDQKDVSEERYVFDGEKSWASYSEMGNDPSMAGKTVVQGYNGKSSWQTVDGTLTSDEGAIKRADFLRKTNYYWFAMMFKLTDPGVTYAYDGTATIEGVTYDKVRMSFEQGVGDAQDIYILYINPYTHMVDQFLFTVMDFGVKDPLLMKVDYVTVDGLAFPAMRRYTRSDWDASVAADASWVLEVMSDIKLNNGFKASLFEQPN